MAMRWFKKMLMDVQSLITSEVFIMCVKRWQHISPTHRCQLSNFWWETYSFLPRLLLFRFGIYSQPLLFMSTNIKYLFNTWGLTTLSRVIILENSKGWIRYSCKNKIKHRTDCLGDFYSAPAVSRHPHIPSWIPHCTVKLKQLREPIF